MEVTDALSVPFLHPLNDKPSFLPSVTVWWSSWLDLGLSRNVSVSSGSSSMLIFLGFVIALSCLLRGFLDKTFEVCPFSLDLFPFILVLGLHRLVLGFSTSHNIYISKIKVICYGFVNNTLFLNSSEVFYRYLATMTTLYGNACVWKEGKQVVSHKKKKKKRAQWE